MIFRMLDDPITFLISMAVSLPGMLIAIVLHEVAHGWVAYRLGDPTAKAMGRLTLNPLKHLDPLGTLMLLVAGVGWAKPVPVDPRYFKNLRRDDLLVSVAGIAMNLLLFLLFSLLANGVLALAIGRFPASSWQDGRLIFEMDGVGYYIEATREAAFRDPMGMGAQVVSVAFGDFAYYAYYALSYIPYINLALAAFNVIPMPPLDGYHVLNDLALKNSVFASPQVSMVCRMALLAVVVATDWLDKYLSFVAGGGIALVGEGFYQLTRLVGAA